MPLLSWAKHNYPVNMLYCTNDARGKIFSSKNFRLYGIWHIPNTTTTCSDTQLSPFLLLSNNCSHKKDDMHKIFHFLKIKLRVLTTNKSYQTYSNCFSIHGCDHIAWLDSISRGHVLTEGTSPITLTGHSSWVMAITVAITQAAPPMSPFMVAIPAEGLMDIPPVSKVTPR